MSYLDSDVKSGDWTIPLGDNDAVNAFLDAIERNPNTVAAQVDLILNSEGPSSDGNELTQPQAARLVHLVKSRKSVDWGHLRLGFRSECPHLLFCTTQLAPLFSKISASAYDSASDSSGCLPLSTAHSILNALQHGNRLQELALCFCVIQEDRMELLSQGIQSTSCPLRSLYLRDVECDHAAHVENKNRRSEPFVLALTKNTTLEDVTFISSFTSTQDVTLVDLFYQMSNTQPPIRWKKLFIVGSDLGKFAQIQDQTVRLVDRLTRMLSHRDCSIVELCLQNCSLGFHYNNTHGRGILQSLMSGVQENSSIQVLNLNNNAFSLADLQFILDGISGCPNLRELELCEEHASLNVPENQNTSWLTNSRLMLPRPGTNLNKLWICDHFPLCNIYDYEDYEEYISSGSHRFMTDAELEAVLLPLLVYNPFICDLGRGLNWRGMPRAAEVLDLNQCLGALRTPPSPAQDQETTESPLSHIPLSLWPTVLERTNRSKETNKRSHERCQIPSCQDGRHWTWKVPIWGSLHKYRAEGCSACGSPGRRAKSSALQHCRPVPRRVQARIPLSTPHRRGILQSLLIGLQENSSIQVLRLNDNGFDETDLQCILNGIVSCLDLRELQLGEDRIEEVLQQGDNLSWLLNSRLLRPHAPTQLRKLAVLDHLPQINMDDDSSSIDSDRKMRDSTFQEVLVLLLVHNPLLHDIGIEGNWEGVSRVKEQLDLNRCVGHIRASPP